VSDRWTSPPSFFLFSFLSVPSLLLFFLHSFLSVNTEHARDALDFSRGQGAALESRARTASAARGATTSSLPLLTFLPLSSPSPPPLLASGVQRRVGWFGKEKKRDAASGAGLIQRAERQAVKKETRIRCTYVGSFFFLPSLRRPPPFLPLSLPPFFFPFPLFFPLRRKPRRDEKEDKARDSTPLCSGRFPRVGLFRWAGGPLLFPRFLPSPFPSSLFLPLPFPYGRNGKEGDGKESRATNGLGHGHAWSRSAGARSQSYFANFPVPSLPSFSFFFFPSPPFSPFFPLFSFVRFKGWVREMEKTLKLGRGPLWMRQTTANGSSLLPLLSSGPLLSLPSPLCLGRGEG